MNWINIKDSQPPYDKPVLLLYMKNKEVVMTQGKLIDSAIKCSRASHPVEFWRSHGYGDRYLDYAGRLIQDTQSKNSKNKVIFWRTLIELPKTIHYAKI